MSRLDIKTRDQSQMVIEGLYQDLERRIVASSAGTVPGGYGSIFFKAVPRTNLRQMRSLQSGTGADAEPDR